MELYTRFVIAPVSPAVVVPRLLELRDNGYGVEKGISTFIIAAACLDNVLAISLFGVTLNFVFPEGSLPVTIIQGPLQVVLGLTFGLVWGGCLGLIFSKDQAVITSFQNIQRILCSRIVDFHLQSV